MTLVEIIKIADKAYGDGAVLRCHEARKGKKTLDKRRRACDESGDGLAEFIAVEIEETYDPDALDADQANRATAVMRKAAKDLEAVADALDVIRRESEA